MREAFPTDVAALPSSRDEGYSLPTQNHSAPIGEVSFPRKVWKMLAENWGSIRKKYRVDGVFISEPQLRHNKMTVRELTTWHKHIDRHYIVHRPITDRASFSSR